MTSYAPPSIDYFSGLQFNPNIYENTVVQGVSKLFGVLVTIVGTISTIITTPLFKVIQGATTTIETTELSTILKSTSYTDIISPNINLAPLGTWAGVSATVGYSQLYNPTQVLIYSNFFQVNTPLMEVNPASYGSSNGTIRFNTYPNDPSVTNSSITAIGGTATPNSGDIVVSANYTAFKNRYVLFDSAARGSNQIDLNFYTNPSSVGTVTSAIYASGGTSSLSGTINASCNTFTVAAPTVNVGNGNGDVTISGNSNVTLGSVTTNINSTFCNVLGNVVVYNQANGWRMWENSNAGSFVQYSASGNILTDTIPWNAILTTRFGFATAITLTLQVLNNYENTSFIVYNAGNANITLAASGGNRLFGPNLTRGGVNSLVIVPNLSLIHI